jgi:hypothetical protein
LENIQRNLIKLFEGNVKEISQFFEGNFDQNKEKKRIFLFFKVEALHETLPENMRHCPKTYGSKTCGPMT